MSQAMPVNLPNLLGMDAARDASARSVFALGMSFARASIALVGTAIIATFALIGAITCEGWAVEQFYSTKSSGADAP